MSKVGLFFGTQWGNTEEVAYQAQRILGEDLCDVFDVSRKPVAALTAYDRLIFGVPTIDRHDMQDDWREFLPHLDGVLHDRPLAMFGLGDQQGFPDAFVNGMGHLYDECARRGAKLVGSWPDNGYAYAGSQAFRQGRFVGLALDVHGQAELTEPRLTVWLAQVLLEFNRV